MDQTIRRVILRHTAGPYPGLRQILGVVEGVGELPDILRDIVIRPSGRPATAMRLRSTRRYVLYQEVAPAATQGVA
jgi:hypothetical protein